LVAEAFLGPGPEGWEIDHLDFDRSNSHVTNLRWVTKAANTELRDRSQRRQGLKLRVGGARLLKAMASLGRFTYRELGEMFGVQDNQARKVALGLSWKWI
jgi:hypothetical protein